MIDGKKSVHMKIHPEIARIIRKTAEIFSCSHAEASMIIFRPATLPLKDFLKLSTKDVEFRIIFNPKNKED